MQVSSTRCPYPSTRTPGNLRTSRLQRVDERAQRHLAERARTQGWGRTRKGPDSWDSKIAKLEEQIERQAISARLAELPEHELYTSDNLPPEASDSE